MKKFTAILLALLLVLFTGCSQTASLLDPYGFSASQGKVTEENLNDNTYILKVGDNGVTLDYFKDTLIVTLSTFSGGDLSIFDTTTEEGKEFYDIAKQYTVDLILSELAMRDIVVDFGIALTEEDEATLQADLDAFIEQNGGEEAYTQAVEASGVSVEYYNNQLYMSKLSNLIYTKITDPESEYAVTDDNINAYVAENYNLVKHILVDETSLEGAVDENGEPYADLEALANAVAQMAQDGEDFDVLIEEYNTDPGMASNPDGYFFTYGEMVSEFETAAFEMDEGDISDPVQTDFGYHILEKQEMTDEAITTNRSVIETQLINLQIQELITEKTAAYELTYTPQYDSLTAEILFPEIFGGIAVN